MAELLTALFTALALAVAIEGALYALFPAAMKRFIAQALSMPDHFLRRTPNVDLGDHGSGICRSGSGSVPVQCRSSVPILAWSQATMREKERRP